MNVTVRKKLCLYLAGALLALPSGVFAADHNDAPDIMGAAGSFVDITDVYAFRSPADPNNLVLYLGIFAPEVAGGPQLFDPNARYELYVDTDNDFAADATISTTFQNVDGGGQTFRITGVDAAGGTIEGPVSSGGNIQVVTDGAARAYCGLRDDHFFFDLVAFQNFVASPCVPTAGLRCPGTGEPQDFFAGRNTSTIVVEFPLTSLPGITSANSGQLNVWSKTYTDN